MPDPVKRILVAADDIAQRARLARLLKSAGLEVELASSLERATSLVSQQRFAAAIIAFSNAIPTLAVAALRTCVSRVLFLRRNEEIRCKISQEVAVLPY